MKIMDRLAVTDAMMRIKNQTRQYADSLRN